MRPALALAVTGLLLVACTGSAPHSDGPPLATTSPPSPSDQGELPVFVNGGDCIPAEVVDLPDHAGCASMVGSGTERLFVYANLDEAGSPARWYLHLDSPSGDVTQRLETGKDYPRAVAAIDVDGDGGTEWWIKMRDYASHGAPWAGLNVFFTRDGRLVPLTLDGEPMAVNYGGISRLGEGARCTGEGLVTLRSEALDPQNTRWRLIERRYRITGTRAVLVGRGERTVVVDSYVDPELRRYFHVQCGGQTLIPF